MAAHSPICRSQPRSALAAEADQLFRDRFSRQPETVACAPGRVNLIGEHTDYNDGFVLPMAIDRYVIVAGAQRDAGENSSSVYSTEVNQVATISLDAGAPRLVDNWANYIQGVVSGFVKRGIVVPKFDACVVSNVPRGAGLSSSAALEVATATFLEGLVGTTLTPQDKALLCQQAEHDYALVPCGIMDQFSSVMCQQDHLMLLDCRYREVTHVPFVAPDVAILVVNSNVHHDLADGEYAQRREECEQVAEILGVQSLRDATQQQVDMARESLGELRYRRARHVVSEITRTLEAVAALRDGNWQHVGELMYASHASLCDDYDVSCDELNTLVEIARSIGQGGGVIGARMTGGGFGGCTINLVHADRVPEVTRELHEHYRSSDQPQLRATIYRIHPSSGASIITHSSCR